MIKKLFDDGLYIGKYASIPVYLDITYLFFLLMVLASSPQFLLQVMCFGLIVLLHEFGHVFAGKYCGCVTQKVKLYFFGGIAFMEIPKDANKEFLIAIGGPLVNVLIAFPLFGLYQTSFEIVFVANFVILFFNLLPAFPLDGGRILRSLLAKISGNYNFATNLACRFSQVVCIIIFFYAASHLNLNLAIIAGLVFFGSCVELINNIPKRTKADIIVEYEERLKKSEDLFVQLYEAKKIKSD